MSKSQIYKGFHFHRTRAVVSIRELVFSSRWKEYCNRTAFPNHFSERKPITRSEAKCIATFVQWLGSNVGFAFLEEILKAAGYELTLKKTEKKLSPDVFPTLWLEILESLQTETWFTQFNTAYKLSKHDSLRAKGYTIEQIKKALFELKEFDLVKHAKYGKKDLWGITNRAASVLVNFSQDYYQDQDRYIHKKAFQLLEI